MPSLEFLQAAPKAPGSFDRCVALEQTLALIPQLRARYAITRIADITHLDRIGIPVMTAIVPESPDLISTYNGKGPTRESALAGAVMEAVERQTGAAPAVGSFIHDGCEVVEGFDLISEEPALVALGAVACPWRGAPLEKRASTDGLAAGNTLSEAVYHALSELVERHLWVTAHALGDVLPRALVSAFAGGPVSLPNFVGDPIAPNVKLPTGSATVDDLTDKIHRAGLTLRLRAFELEPFPVLFIATIGDPAGGRCAAHTGFGCSWSPVHAAVRAITEAAQSRAADFQAAREDLRREDDPLAHGLRRSVGLPLGSWYYDAPARTRTLASFPDKATNDVACDVQSLLAALRHANVERAVIVDLSPSDGPIHVVRAVIPALKTQAVPSPHYQHN
jgi:ribosomal protein S12 methylthiotransferase accessory factor